jgi:hypothetical protein
MDDKNKENVEEAKVEIKEEEQSLVTKFRNWLDSKDGIFNWVFGILAVYNLYKQYFSNPWAENYWFWVIVFAGLVVLHTVFKVRYSTLFGWIAALIAALVALFWYASKENTKNDSNYYKRSNNNAFIQAAYNQLDGASNKEVRDILEGKPTRFMDQNNFNYSLELTQAAEYVAKERNL